jgi:hypothetical protein
MIQLKVQTFLDDLQLWLSLWRLKLSVKKTVFTIFNPGGKNLSSEISLSYNGGPICYELNPRFLGIYLDPSITFYKHAKVIRERAIPRINMIKHLRSKDWGMNHGFLLVTYKAPIRSLMDYSPQVTLSMCESSRKIYESIQSKAVRLATKWPCLMTNKAMLERYKLQTIAEKTQHLFNRYLLKANRATPMINNEIKTYNIAPLHKERLFWKLKILIRLQSEYRIIFLPISKQPNYFNKLVFIVYSRFLFFTKNGFTKIKIVFYKNKNLQLIQTHYHLIN